MPMAYRAGAELRDMEFMQFHPTVLYIAGSSRSLITEAVRGEGGHPGRLATATASCPTTTRAAELAPRDVVSQAIVDQMEKTRHPNVYLDLSHSTPTPCARGSPASPQLAASSASTSRATAIPVRPGAHYMIGGVTVDHRRPHDARRACGPPAK